MEDKKVKLLVYATESERTRIKLAATRLEKKGEAL